MKMEQNVTEWAEQQWSRCELGDERLTQRAVEMGRRMATRPSASIPKQMEGRAGTIAAYRLLNNRRVSAAKLLGPHLEHTRQAVAEVTGKREGVVLMIHDKTTLLYTHHPKAKGTGPAGSNGQRGMLMASVLAVEPRDRQVLGLAYVEMIVREEDSARPRHNGGRRSAGPEGKTWENGVRAIGAPPSQTGQGRVLHVADRESDIFEFMQACVAHGTGFVVRARWNRQLADRKRSADDEHQHDHERLLDVVRRLEAGEAQAGYTVIVDAARTSPKREARIALSWCQVDLMPPTHVRRAGALRVTVVRAWEVDAPPGVEPVEWILLTSEQVDDAADARRITSYYECRWIIEDFHQVLKTGCRVEDSQLDDIQDIQTLIGFLAPLAVRLLQLRHIARATPDRPAAGAVDPLLLKLLCKRFTLPDTITIQEFWLRTAQLGGYLANPKKHPPGWRSLWTGFLKLNDWADGVRLLSSGPEML